MNSTRNTRRGIAVTMLPAAMQMQGGVTALTEQEQYEADALRAERMDEIRQFIKSCEDAEMVAMYNGPATQKLRSPFKHIPRHARPSDYGCASEWAVSRAQRELGLAM